MKNSSRFLMNLIFISLFLAVVVHGDVFSKNSSYSNCSRDDELSVSHPTLNQNPIIKKACAQTLYPSLCFDAVSCLPPPPPTTSKINNATTLRDFLVFFMGKTKNSVHGVRMDILAQSGNQDLMSSPQEKNAYEDCVLTLDQTLYQLGLAIDDLLLNKSPSSYSYGNLKTLLSAAMTNENTCIDGFSDLEEFLSYSNSKSQSQKGLKKYFQTLLTPTSRMISNCLALIKYMENTETGTGTGLTGSKRSLRDWKNMNNVDEKMVERIGWIVPKPNVTVSLDGSGDYTHINEAIEMAPNGSTNTYVIKINSGIYEENVIVPRKKIRLTLIGSGMKKTIIKGSRNFVDGYSTFASATLTVFGEKFIARDMTIINTSGPEKHQAVAVLVTSNAAFYRCGMISYQDTLYAHSLRQYFQDCLIQGTVDFIFGNAAAIFKNCLILVRKPGRRQKNMITAQGRSDPNQNTGISLQNCTIKAATDFTMTDWKGFPTFLGRPWRNYSRTIITNTYLDGMIDPRGWSTWDEYTSVDTVEYIEYMNSGPGSDTSNRITWPGYRKNCTEDVAKKFTLREFLHGADYWLISLVFPLIKSPSEHKFVNLLKRVQKRT